MLTELGTFDAPVFLAQPPEDSAAPLFVVEQSGAIRVVRDGQTLGKPFLDVSDEISFEGEQGLFSMAFAPDYADSGLFYVSYTDTEGDSRIVEYSRSADDPLVADPGSAREVLFQDQPYPNHNGGLIAFGPDGLLYIAFGDGGDAGDPDRNAQDLGTFLGKLLRIDPRADGGEPYSVPEDNPFVGRDGALPEIYSLGLRNPWRFSFDRQTGALSIGDVGQDSFEEIDFVQRGEGAGANFGWSAWEGTSRFNDDQQAPGHVRPVLTYSYGDDGACSVTGGYVVRDPELTSLYGRYLYADFCIGALRSFIPEGEQARDDKALGPVVPALSSFAEDSDGNLYALALEGQVYRLDPQP